MYPIEQLYNYNHFFIFVANVVKSYREQLASRFCQCTLCNVKAPSCQAWTWLVKHIFMILVLFIAQFWFSCVWGFSLSSAYNIYAKGTDEEALMSFEIYLPMYLPSCLTSTQKSLSKAYRWLYCTAYRETQKIFGFN